MPNYEAVSKELHKNKYWKPVSNFRFAAQDALCSLVMQEAPKAVLHLPIAFSKAGEHFALFAVQGLKDGENHLIDAAGNWLTGYIPAAYRGYPFALANSDEQLVLCIDTDSGLINDNEGEAFFDELDEPSPRIKEILDFLSQVATNKQTTHTLCLLLAELELLEPWPITVNIEDKDVSVEGLYRISEAKFNTLDTDTLTSLRDKGALPLIFCQLLSMQNLAHIVEKTSQSSPSTALPNKLFDLGGDGNISFESI